VHPHVARTAQVLNAPAAPALAAAAGEWLGWLAAERRASPHTLAAYRRDLEQFLRFLAEHLGGTPDIGDLAKLAARDLRAWLAARAKRGLDPSSTARALSTIRSFAHRLARRGIGDLPAIRIVRTPKVGKSVPKALAEVETESLLAEMETGEDWVARRDRALFMLLYGAGLRIAEALALDRADAPRADGTDHALRIRGKGGKERVVPILPAVAEAVRDYLAAVPFAIPGDGPLFVGTRSARLVAAVAQAQSSRNHDAARAAPQLCDAPDGSWERSPDHPGTAGARVAVDHPTLHAGRRRAPEEGLSERASPRAQVG
jgi:integrase/recombinase XerC